MGVNDTSIVSNEIRAIGKNANANEKENKSKAISILWIYSHMLSQVVLIFQVIYVGETTIAKSSDSLNMLRNILRMAKMCVRGNTIVVSNTTAKHKHTRTMTVSW